MKQKHVPPRSASRQPCIKSAASPQCLQWSVQLVSGTFCIIINTYIISLVLGANRQQRLIRMTKTSNHERKMTAPAQFLFQCAPLIALTTQLLKGSQAPKWNDDTSARLQFRGSWHSLQTVRLALMSREADADLHLLCPGTLMLSVLGSLWLQRGGGKHCSVLETFGKAVVVCWEHPASWYSLRDRHSMV